MISSQDQYILNICILGILQQCPITYWEVQKVIVTNKKDKKKKVKQYIKKLHVHLKYPSELPHSICSSLEPILSSLSWCLSSRQNLFYVLIGLISHHHESLKKKKLTWKWSTRTSQVVYISLSINHSNQRGTHSDGDAHTSTIPSPKLMPFPK